MILTRYPGGASDAIDGEDLDPPWGDQRLERCNHLKAFTLLCVTAGGGEKEHRHAVMAPADQSNLLLKPVGIPVGAIFHRRVDPLRSGARIESIPRSGR